MSVFDKNLSSSLILDKLYGSNTIEPPSHVLEFDDIVVCCEFSTYLWSHDLICIAFPSKIVVASLKFKEEDDDQIEPLRYDVVRKYTCYNRIQSITWSPETNIKKAPKTILFAVSTNTFEIDIYSLTVADTFTHKITAHRNYINDISYDPTGEYLASVSDDLTCRIWAVKDGYSEICKFYLESSPIAVKWHKDDPGKLLVGESFGLVTVYNVMGGTTVMSFRSKGSPLVSLHWSPSDSQYISGICGGNLVIWYVCNPSVPCYEKLVYPDGGFFVKFSPLCSQSLVTLGSPDFSLKVLSKNKPFPRTIATMKTVSSISFHQHLPYLCVGVKKNIYIWLIT